MSKVKNDKTTDGTQNDSNQDLDQQERMAAAMRQQLTQQLIAAGCGFGSSLGTGFGYGYGASTPGFGTGPKNPFAGTTPFPDISSFYEKMFEIGKTVEKFENHCNLVLEKYGEEKSQTKTDIKSIVDHAKEIIAAVSPFGNKTFSDCEDNDKKKE
jgi:hypothetical protein